MSASCFPYFAVGEKYRDFAVRNVPRVAEIRDRRILDAFFASASGDQTFFLDSSMKHDRWGRYSFCGADPFLTLRSLGRFSVISTDTGSFSLPADPFYLLDSILDFLGTRPTDLPFPFAGGAVGYLGYDLGRWVERVPCRASADLPFPDMVFAFYRSFFAADHQEGRLYYVRWQDPDHSLSVPEIPENKCTFETAGGRLIDRSFCEEDYIRAVERAQEYISAGDIFQVNLSQRFTYNFQSNPSALYSRLREINPAPFSAYLDIGSGMRILSSSPERFLFLRSGEVHTCPIKGTRPRGRPHSAADRAVQEELLRSEKDNAELCMIVDLERNDLGRVCDYGSVRVVRDRELHTFATVHHLISTVEGRLCPGTSVSRLLKAAFPGGSITGAPKVRAMEIVEELEPYRRSIYTGSIGYIGFDRTMDMNIVIRTLLTAANTAWYQVGGGIVADSVPRDEYEETLAKGKALEAALVEKK